MLKLYSVTVTDLYASVSLEVFRHPAKTNQVGLLHTSQPSEMLSAADSRSVSWTSFVWFCRCSDAEQTLTTCVGYASDRRNRSSEGSLFFHEASTISSLSPASRSGPVVTVTGQLVDTPTRGLPTRGLDDWRTGHLADWSTRGLDNSRTGQVADWTTRGYANSRIANSRTGHLADWTSRGLVNSRTRQLAH